MHKLTPKVAYLADCATRRDLADLSIADERAYVAAWLTRIRDMWAAQGSPSFFVARQPTYAQEVANGIDAILVIQIDDYYKAIGIEAKRPGMGAALSWDKVVPGPNVSRFHRQLLKQQALVNWGWTMGGLFLNEIYPGTTGPSGTDLHGATFIPRAALLATSATIIGTPPKHWKTSDVLALMTTTSVYNVEDLLELVIRCSSGRPLKAEQLLQSALMFSTFGIEDDVLGRSRHERSQDLPGGHPSSLLLRELCHFTGARSAVLLDATRPGQRGDKLPPEWRERILDETLPPAADNGVEGGRPRF